jgi:hypothetical protein
MATPDETIIKLKIWFDEAQEWLHTDGTANMLQRPHRQLLELMIAARNENRSSRVWELIEELEKLTLRMTDVREQGEVLIRCAKMATNLENLKDALRLCQAAESKYKSYPHQRAVALWMVGCIHWIMHQRVDAISSWQEAISIFKERKLSVQVDVTKVKWYIEMVPQLEQYLEQAIKLEVLPPYEPASDTKSDSKPASKKDSNELDSLRWLACTISDSVPAGGFGPAGFDPASTGFLEITEILIEHEPYQIYSTRRTSVRGNSVNIASSLEYRTIRVKGTSMNAARPVSINDGDYVLVHLHHAPTDNDIVVAGIFELDKLATIKRLKYRNGKIQLVPESTDQEHYNNLDFEKELEKSEINIVGVVEAVFKKKLS